MEQVCRTCLATCGDLVSIFSTDYYVHNLPAKLFHTMRIEVSIDDGLPKTMCKKCIFIVDSMFCFKDQCEMAEIKLKKTLQESFTDDITYTMYNASEIDKNTVYQQHYVVGDQDVAIVSNSDEEYDVEYVSEEARIEVERAKNRKKSKRHSRNSGVIVKSVEIIQPENKDDIFKNFHTKNEIVELDENQEQQYNEECCVVEGSENDNGYTREIVYNPVNIYGTSHQNSNEDLDYKVEESDDYQYENPVHAAQVTSHNLHKVSKRKLSRGENSNQTHKMQRQSINNIMPDNGHGSEYVENVQVLNENMEYQNDNTYEMNNTEYKNYDTIIYDSKDNIKKENVSLDLRLINDPQINLLMSNYVDKEKHTVTIYDIAKRIASLIKSLSLNFPAYCLICSKSFDSYCSVLKHKIEKHIDQKKDLYYCPVCHSKFYSKVDLINHLNNHNDIHASTCMICNGNFYTEESLIIHLLTHVDIKEIKCRICFKKCQRFHNLAFHTESHISSEKLVCKICLESFQCKNELQKHLNESHTKPDIDIKFKCETCSAQVLESEREEHMKSHSTYPCPYCEKTFTVKLTLRDHVYSHLGVIQFTCLVCEKTFKTSSERVSHMQQEHMKPPQKSKKRYKCRVCHIILTSRLSYGKHIKEKHWNSDEFKDIFKEFSDCLDNSNPDNQVDENISVLFNSN